MKTYGGVFYSVLTLPVYKDPIDTLEDLERVALSGEYDIVTYPDSYYYQFFVEAKCCDSYYKIGRAMKNSRIKMPNNLDLGIILVENSRSMDKQVIFINAKSSLMYGMKSNATMEMHISSEVFTLDHSAMALQKGSPLLDSMNIE